LKLKAEINKTNANLMTVKQSIEACKLVVRTKLDKTLFTCEKLSVKRSKAARGLVMS
jgi:hypothetical protein